MTMLWVQCHRVIRTDSIHHQTEDPRWKGNLQEIQLSKRGVFGRATDPYYSTRCKFRNSKFVVVPALEIGRQNADPTAMFLEIP